MVSYNCALDTTLAFLAVTTAAHSRTVTLSPRQHKLRVDERHDALDERHRTKCVRAAAQTSRRACDSKRDGLGTLAFNAERTAFSTRKLHKRLHPCPQRPSDRLNTYGKAPISGLLQSPLTDSNRRPPPYHRATRREARAKPGSRVH